jgi:hypothetical protein
MGATMDVHEGEELVVQRRHVLVTVHCHLGRQEEDRYSATLAAEAAHTITLTECLTLTSVNFCF